MRASIASCVACPLPSIPALRSFRAASVCRYLRLHRAAKASPSPAAMHVLQIVSGSVTVVFDFEFPDEIVSDLAALDEAAYLRQCDRFALLDSIYAFRKPDGPVRSDAKFAVTAAAYLAAMT